MKHTPLIQLQAAGQNLEAARQECPHWDYESDGYTFDACCQNVEYAKHEYRLARIRAGKRGCFVAP